MIARPQTINLYVPGILTFPGDGRNWCGRAVTHTHINSELRAEKVEYLSGFGFTRSLFQKERAEKLARTLSFYAGWCVRLIGHSNGCDVIADTLQQIGSPNIQQVHLVCGACEADFEKNGLNKALLDGAVDNVFVYVAEKDQALRLARTCIGSMLGFGTLGLHGAVNVDDRVSHRVGELRWPGFGHSDCWADANFTQTMDHFLRS